MKKEKLNKTIQEIENDYWKEPSESITDFIKNCHKYRKKKVKNLEIREIITLLVQDIGSEILMPIVLEKMRNNIFEADDYDGSTFIGFIEIFSANIWFNFPKYYKQLMEILNEKQDIVLQQWDKKRFKRLLKNMKKKTPFR